MGMFWKGKKGLSVPLQGLTLSVAETAQLHLKVISCTTKDYYC